MVIALQATLSDTLRNVSKMTNLPIIFSPLFTNRERFSIVYAVVFSMSNTFLTKKMMPSGHMTHHISSALGIR